MTANNKAVKERGLRLEPGAGWLYSPDCRELEFSETRIQLYETLSNRTRAKRRFAPR
jgi:hypothetical protein